MVVEAFTGDADELVEAFHPQAVLTDQPGEPPVHGQPEIMGFFMAYGGRREVARVHDVFFAGDRGALSYTVWFRSDAHSYGQHGRVLLTFDAPADTGGVITRWDGVWVEVESTLEPWSGD